ncbi:MAG: FmdB family zinc ribbon protein [Planctomycetota bacterium]|jgi:putative FmdB family regulatory protein
MPTYEYECRDCGHRFERFQSMTAKPIRVCPKCKKREVKRLLGTGAGIIFKGSGFYETDYKRKSTCGTGGNGKHKDAKKPENGKNGESGKTAEKPAENKKSEPTPKSE